MKRNKYFRLLLALLILASLSLAACSGFIAGDPTNPIGSNFSAEGGTIVIQVPVDYPIDPAYVDFNGIMLTVDRVAAQVPGFDPSLLIGDPAIAEKAGITHYALFTVDDQVVLDINGAVVESDINSAQTLIAGATNTGMLPVEGGAALSAALDFVEGTGWAFRYAVVYPGFDPAVDVLPWVAADLAAAQAAQAAAAAQPTPAPVATLSPLASQLVAASQPAVPANPSPWEGLDLTGDPFSPLDYESPSQAARRIGTQGYSGHCLRLFFEAVVEWDWEPNGDGNPNHWDYWRTDVNVPLPALCLN